MYLSNGLARINKTSSSILDNEDGLFCTKLCKYKWQELIPKSQTLYNKCPNKKDKWFYK